jgi:protein-L-isoaspartate(D-aspartate) O-methyltransferase
MCALRGGQPNVTLLPAEEGGIVVDLLVPLSVGHDVLKLLRARSKEARTLAKLKYLKEAPSELRAESPQQCRGAAEEEDPLTLPVNADINVARPVANPDDPGQGRAVVWFHGLGDTSLSWVKRLASVLPHIGGVANFHQPVAPLRHDPITTTSAPSDHATASWFDLKALPVTADSEPAEAPKGLEDAIKVAHTTIDTLVKQGIPAQSILLGGFSQGAAVAIAAGISYPQHLAGIVSISGWWCTCREDLASKVHGSNSTIPMWFSYGTADDTVDSKLSSVSAELLGSALQEGSVQVTKVQRKKHSPNNVELKAACTWMVEQLTPSGGTDAEKAMPKPEVAAAEASQARDTTRSAPALQGCWTCSGTSNDEMVGKLEAAGIISAPSLKAAMLATDRALYVPHEETTSEPDLMATTQTSNAGKIRNKKASSSYSYGPYADAPQAIGWKATISAPHTHGKALDLLAGHLSRPGCRVLDVGCGSGMLVALMARMALYSSTHSDDGNPTEFDGSTLPRAVIVGIDRVPGLVGLGTRNLARDGFDVETSASSEAGFASPPSTPLLVVRHGDGWEGAKDIGPFDAIHVGASPPVIPEALLQQLKPGGRMIVPVGEPRVIKERGGSTMQEWTQVDRHISGCSGGSGPTTADEFAFEVISTVRFVPLVAPSF